MSQENRTVEETTDAFDHDLHGNDRAGQHAGVATDRDTRHTAYDIKELHDRLRDFHNDELRQIPVLQNGSRLEQGAIYLDLMVPERGVFTASGALEAEAGHAYVPKSETAYPVWNRLIGISTSQEAMTNGDDAAADPQAPRNSA
jgi:hypothetical protein